MHCIVKKTLQTIIATGNDYVVCIKKNQHKLYKQLVEESKQWKTKIGYYKTKEKNRGREETRKIFLYRLSEELQREWAGAKLIVKVKRIRQVKNEVKKRDWYYLSSVELTAKELGEGIRRHWFIENKLHWIKDMVFNEDTSTIKDFQASAILSIIRTIVLNRIVKTGEKRITRFMMMISHDIGKIKDLIE